MEPSLLSFSTFLLMRKAAIKADASLTRRLRATSQITSLVGLRGGAENYVFRNNIAGNTLVRESNSSGGCNVGVAKAVSDRSISAGGDGVLVWITISRHADGVKTLCV